ncbi:MAG TPA: LLM class flavin-dependent oxidoreductase [Nitrososphaeraceae archaeon]|jgi:alkanesulfonate monooxygenase SsuD/methylene tetrahydromethanopterin reductase-like flavin-dependent oxidoreductase (luciferase family)
MKKFKIGFSLGPLLSIGEVLAIAKLADQSGLVDSIWVPESWGRDTFSTLGALTQVTQKIRLGSSIVNIYSRTPATVAMGAVTIDNLSNMRTILGIGTSTPELVSGWHGMEFNEPLERTREFIECLRLIFGGARVNYKGNHFKITDFTILETLARYTLPIYLGAVNQKMINLAYELADGVIFYLRPIEELRLIVSKLKSQIKSNPRKQGFEIASSIICAMSSRDPEKARERASKTLAYYISTGRYYKKFLAKQGFETEVSSITDRYKNGGLKSATKAITEKLLNSLTISGSIDDCLKAFERFLSTGITLPIIQINPVDDSISSFKEMLSTFKCKG